jgi:hypothetical protein
MLILETYLDEFLNSLEVAPLAKLLANTKLKNT